MTQNAYLYGIIAEFYLHMGIQDHRDIPIRGSPTMGDAHSLSVLRQLVHELILKKKKIHLFLPNACSH